LKRPVLWSADAFTELDTAMAYIADRNPRPRLNPCPPRSANRPWGWAFGQPDVAAA
jgi:hypothetical protein